MPVHKKVKGMAYVTVLHFYNALVEIFSTVEELSYLCAFQRDGKYAHRLSDNESGTRHL
jgi:hypothetical protein